MYFEKEYNETQVLVPMRTELTHDGKCYTIWFDLNETEGLNTYALKCIYITLMKDQTINKIGEPRIVRIKVTDASEENIYMGGSIPFIDDTTCTEFVNHNSNELFDDIKNEYIEYDIAIVTTWKTRKINKLTNKII